MIFPKWIGVRPPAFDLGSIPDDADKRFALARFYLNGQGLEIGALHKPLQVDPEKASVSYVDYKTLEENRTRYPELKEEIIVDTDIVDDGFVLSKVKPASFDFLVANHALEHSPDPLGTLDVWLSKIRPGGFLFVAIPIAEKCYDSGRPITSLSHFCQDQRSFRVLDT